MISRLFMNIRVEGSKPVHYLESDILAQSSESYSTFEAQVRPHSHELEALNCRQLDSIDEEIE